MRKAIFGAAFAALGTVSAFAQTPGVTPTEIRIGQTIAYSGPASAYGQLGKAEQAYFDSINAKGGINGRKIKFISRDDAYSPPKAVENARRLVEEDDVALVFGVLGTPINMAIRPYLNGKGVPLLFIAAGSSAGASSRKALPHRPTKGARSASRLPWPKIRKRVVATTSAR